MILKSSKPQKYLSYCPRHPQEIFGFLGRCRLMGDAGIIEGCIGRRRHQSNEVIVTVGRSVGHWTGPLPDKRCQGAKGPRGQAATSYTKRHHASTAKMSLEPHLFSTNGGRSSNRNKRSTTHVLNHCKRLFSDFLSKITFLTIAPTANRNSDDATRISAKICFKPCLFSTNGGRS